MLHFPSISEDEFQEGCQAFSRCAAEEAKSITSSGLIVDIVSGALTIEKEYSLTTHDDDNNKNENDYDDVKEEATSTAEATETTETAREELDGLTDDDDHEAIETPSTFPAAQSLLVQFSVLRSATYEVPVLWLTMKRLPSTVSSGLGTVYRLLVPDAARPGLAQTGVMGGISIANHPVTGLPAFFIHPCNTAQALDEICQEKPRSPEAYLLAWFGLVGPLVDLYIPSQLSFAIMDGRL